MKYNHIILSTLAHVFIGSVTISYHIQFVFIINHNLIILIFDLEIIYPISKALLQPFLHNNCLQCGFNSRGGLGVRECVLATGE